MYCGVPITAPTIVAIWVPSVAGAGRSVRAMPKSATSAMPSSEQDVLGLDVAVHEVLLMRVRERARDLARQPQRLVQRQLRLAARAARAAIRPRR